MKIKFNKSFMFLHIILSYIIQLACGKIFMQDIKSGDFILPLFYIVVVNYLQFISVRKLFHAYKLNHKHSMLFIFECTCAAGFVVYNMICNRLVYESGTVYFLDIFVTLIFTIPFVLSMARAEEIENK